MEVNGTRLRELREARVLSMQDLALAAALDRQTIYALENGRRRNAHPKTIRKLAAALDVEAQELVNVKP